MELAGAAEELVLAGVELVQAEVELEWLFE